jgi:hypothetical protein
VSGDRSWEDYVNAVCVKGRPGRLDGLALDWDAVFRNAASVTQSLRDGIKELKAHWKGPAADDYFAKLGSIADSVEQFENDNKPITDLLRRASGALATAQTTMPVPDNMLDEVQGRQDQLDQANQAGAYGMVAATGTVLLPGVGTVAALFMPRSFMNGLANSFVGDWGREIFGGLDSWIEDWGGKMTDQAKQIFDTADKQYTEGAAVTAPPSPVRSTFDTHTLPQNFGPGPGGPGVSPFGGPDPRAGHIDPNLGHTIDPNLATHTGTDPSFNPGADPFNPGTGLSGAGGGGLTGAGGGLTGFNPAGGLGGGSLTAAAGVGGGGAVGVGRGVSPMMPPMGAMGGMGAGGRGAAGSRRATTGPSRGGMIGGGHGAGMGGAEDDRSNWLVEDDDVWGEGDAAPGVLK